MKRSVQCVLILCLLVVPFTLTAGGKKESLQPIKVSMPEIPNHEYLVYVAYYGGQKTREIHLVNEIDPEKKTIATYMHQLDFEYGENLTIPPDFHDWFGKMTFSAENGCMVDYLIDFRKIAEEVDMKGIVGQEIHADGSTGGITVRTTSWDGYEEHESVARMTAVPGIPYTNGSMMVTNLRFMDLRSSGVMAYIEPQILADPIYAKAVVDAHEDITVGGRTYRASKAGMSSVDPMINKLVGPLLKMMRAWIDESPSRYVLKIVGQGAEGESLTQLEHIGIWNGTVWSN